MPEPSSAGCGTKIGGERLSGRREQTQPSDIASAEAYLRRLDLNLRTPDALNIAIAQRVGATLVTFDLRMAEAARTLGTAVAPA